MIKRLTIDKEVTLQIWNSAGQEGYESLYSVFFKGAHGFIIVYDVTDLETFKNVKKWLTELKNISNCPVILVGNKCDQKQDKLALEKAFNLLVKMV